MSVKTANKRRNPVADFHRTQTLNVSRWQHVVFPDILLVLCLMLLVGIGVVMVASASTPIAALTGRDKFYFVYRQAIYYGVTFFVMYGAFSLKTSFWEKRATLILILALLALLAVHLPMVGVSVNGSRRWLNLGVVRLQSGEIAKLAMIIFTAACLFKAGPKLENSIKPMLLIILVAGLFGALLLMQPDFGTTLVILMTVFGMMFIAGTPLRYFVPVAIVGMIGMVAILIAKPYRVKRLMTFLDPFKYQQDEGYQLANSLIAIGRGHWHGVGLGESVFKHQFVPEAHTDFIFAIICEEFGLIGALTVMVIFAVMVWRAFVIGALADKVRKRFSCYLAYGIGLWMALQSMINFGVVMGALPTKGLTLPFISYGGSSLLITGMAFGILMRIDAESRFQAKREGLL